MFPRFACLRCGAGGHFVTAGGALRAPRLTLINYMVDNISKYVCLTVIIDIARKITKFQFLLMHNDDVITIGVLNFISYPWTARPQ